MYGSTIRARGQAVPGRGSMVPWMTLLFLCMLQLLLYMVCGIVLGSAGFCMDQLFLRLFQLLFFMVQLIESASVHDSAIDIYGSVFIVFESFIPLHGEAVPVLAQLI